MINDIVQDPNYSKTLRLFVEEICCELCRFQHVVEDGISPEAVQINREVRLDAPNEFADIQVRAPGIACVQATARRRVSAGPECSFFSGIN